MDYQDRLAKNKIKQVSTSLQDTSVPEPKREDVQKDKLEALAKVADEFEKRIEQNVKEEKKEELIDYTKDVDDTYFYDAMGTRRPNLYSNKRKKEIESRLKPLDIAEIVFKRRAEQTIPIIPGKLEVTLRETSGKEDRFMKDQIAKMNMGDEKITTASVMARMALFQLTFSLLEINGKSLQDVSIKRDPPSEEELKRFNDKLDFISEYPDDFLEELNIQLQWFKDRVKMLSMEAITNFSNPR